MRVSLVFRLIHLRLFLNGEAMRSGDHLILRQAQDEVD